MDLNYFVLRDGRATVAFPAVVFSPFPFSIARKRLIRWGLISPVAVYWPPIIRCRGSVVKEGLMLDANLPESILTEFSQQEPELFTFVFGQSVKDVINGASTVSLMVCI